MSTFFSRAGNFLHSYVEITGESNHKTCTAWFYYTNGHSSYDGRTWNYVLNDAE